MKDRILTKERLEEYRMKIATSPAIKEISDALHDFNGATLVGGAVIDIIEGRVPKDYDFIGFNELLLPLILNKGFTFVTETAYAYTYKFGEYDVQFLKRTLHSFDFKISQSMFKTKEKELWLDRPSFENKLLIPVNFEDHKMLKEALVRIPHWKVKGYEMHDSTYLSICEELFNLKRKSS